MVAREGGVPLLGCSHSCSLLSATQGKISLKEFEKGMPKDLKEKIMARLATGDVNITSVE